jgi:hypothetical protein
VVSQKLKVFGGNWYGKERRVVAARTQKEACEILDITAYEFRNHWCESGNEAEIKAALGKPGTVFRTCMTSNKGIEPVTE